METNSSLVYNKKWRTSSAQRREQGIYSFVVTQDAWEIGYEAVNRLNTIQAQLEKNDLRKIQSEIVPEYLEVVCVTKDNLDQYPQTDGEELDWDVY